jgi:hypothetical protein
MTQLERRGVERSSLPLAATLRLVEGYVRYKALGPQSLQGMDTPVSVYRVLSEGVAQSLLEVAARH